MCWNLSDVTKKYSSANIKLYNNNFMMHASFQISHTNH